MQFFRDKSTDTLPTDRSSEVLKLGSGKHGAITSVETFRQTLQNSPRYTRFTEDHLNQCINVVEKTKEYQDMRQAEKTQRSIGDYYDVDEYATPVMGLPELGQSKLAREYVSSMGQNPLKFKEESQKRLCRQASLYRIALKSQKTLK